MAKLFSEDEVHEHLYKIGLEDLIIDCPGIDDDNQPNITEEDKFELWPLIKQKAISKIARLHKSVRYGRFITSKLKLPTDNRTPMELDLLGVHGDGLFVLELKVDRSAERNAFSELFAYSNYIAGMFALSGRHDIANVLVANLDAKITRQAFLYDLLIADRDIIVYKPKFSGSTLDTLQLELHLPSDEDFEIFVNDLLSHDSMSCAVVSFHDLDGWFDSKEHGGNLNQYTLDHLGGVSSYIAQLMDADGLHGFCFVRKRWQEIPSYYRNSIFICAIDPFRLVTSERAEVIIDQLSEEDIEEFFESARWGFQGRLIRIAQRGIKECLTHDYHCEVELPEWSGVVNSMVEVVLGYNFAFRPTGMFREAYVSYLQNLYALNNSESGPVEDVSLLKINEITNWWHAWQFMEACGLTKDDLDEKS